MQISKKAVEWLSELENKPKEVFLVMAKPTCR
jgi:hypothetical protein